MKVGLELFTRLGPQALAPPRSNGFGIMLDLKLHDIPNTVERAVHSACSHKGIDFLTVHAAGGSEMMKRAVGAAQAATDPVTVLAITVLTSLAGEDFRRIFNQTPNDVEYVVQKLATIAYEAGARGFVCSPLEVKALRSLFSHDDGVTLVVPGIRPKGSSSDDQKRIATPTSAIQDGADYLVIGRPIRKAPDPIEAARTIAAEMKKAAH